jgi:hypothetical protein
MKYLITESKLEETIINYFYKLFPVDNIHSTNPTDYDGENGENYDDETRVEFYIGDYGDEDTCFRWYDCEYFYPDNQIKVSCPMVSVEHEYEKILNGYFNEMWHEPFKKWFTENFELPVKTIDN